MSIDWNVFTPWSALLGGLTIGLAVAIYLLGNGQVAGIAGIVADPLHALTSGRSLAPEAQPLLFIGGLMLAPWLWRLVEPFPGGQVDVGWPVSSRRGCWWVWACAWATAAPAAMVCVV